MVLKKDADTRFEGLAKKVFPEGMLKRSAGDSACVIEAAWLLSRAGASGAAESAQKRWSPRADWR